MAPVRWSRDQQGMTQCYQAFLVSFTIHHSWLCSLWKKDSHFIPRKHMKSNHTKFDCSATAMKSEEMFFSKCKTEILGGGVPQSLGAAGPEWLWLPNTGLVWIDTETKTKGVALCIGVISAFTPSTDKHFSSNWKWQCILHSNIGNTSCDQYSYA